MAFDLADRGIYGFSTTENLRFADVDANGHINNGAFLELLENVRVAYLRQIVRTDCRASGWSSAVSRPTSNARCSIPVRPWPAVA